MKSMQISVATVEVPTERTLTVVLENIPESSLKELQRVALREFFAAQADSPVEVFWDKLDEALKAAGVS